MSEIEQVLEKMKQLFITVRYKYIKLNQNGEYHTFNKIKNQNHKPLHDGFLRSHIQQQSTYGIFCREGLTKFISFDVDVENVLEAKRVVLALYDALNALSVPSDKIHTSWSGTKGYHVDIYFSTEIPYNLIKILFNAAISRAYDLLGGKIEGKVELRPTPTQGLKLPLSIHHKNNDETSNICWYIDVDNNFSTIRSFKYFLSIEPMQADIIKDLIYDIPDNREDNIKRSKTNNQLTEVIEIRDIDLSEETLDSLYDYYISGLKKPGTRNSVTCKLAVYFNTLKESKSECEQKLRDWMQRQDRALYKTRLNDCYKEITRIVKIVYDKNIVFNNGLTEITVSRSEMLSIYQYPKKFHKTLFALFIHSKRFKDLNSEFFMTYEQLALAAQCSDKTAITHVKLLEKDNLIKVTRSPISLRGNRPESRPNFYKLNLRSLSADKDISYNVAVTNVKDYQDLKISIIKVVFPNNEWWNITKILNSIEAKEPKDNN